jgi:TPR repeat protein
MEASLRIDKARKLVELCISNANIGAGRTIKRAPSRSPGGHPLGVGRRAVPRGARRTGLRCNILGAILLEQGGDANVERALDEFEKLCNRDQGIGCDNLGQLYARGGGRHPPDLGKARAAFQRACDLENALGCTHLGQVAAGS